MRYIEEMYYPDGVVTKEGKKAYEDLEKLIDALANFKKDDKSKIE